MKRSWLSILSITGLLGLLALLATLQYVWLGQISDGERERLKKRLQTDTQRFADDFNEEIRGAYFTFQIDPGDWLEKDWTEFNKRYESWLSKTNYPQLIKDIYFVGKDSPPIRYDAKAQKFEPTEWTENLTKVKEKINNNQTDTIMRPTVLDSYTLLMGNYAQGKLVKTIKNLTIEDIPRVEPEMSGYVVIELDENVVNQLLANLDERYFSDGETSDYNLAVIRKSDSKIIHQKLQNSSLMATDTSDASGEIFDLTSDNFKLLTNSRIITTRNQNTKSDTHQEIAKNTNVMIARMDKNSSLKVFLNEREKKEKEIKNNGLWTLKVRHADGSLEQFISNTRRKNLAISFGILFLLAVSVILIFLSAQRAKRFAQKQVDFVSAVSHEFRTPLAVIYSAGENLTDGVVNSDKQVVQYGDLIKREGKKLSQMVEQILEFAGARSGHRKYDLHSSNVRAIVEDALDACQSLLKEKGFVVERDIADNLPVISADQNALSCAIQNLITNAVKYGDGGNWIKVMATTSDGRVKISVEDKGIGIAPQQALNIFMPFYRAKSVIDAQIHGNGLGLSLVKQTVEAHGGRVSVESAIGKGSRFTIHLPFII